jgi:hypothetical protein
MEQGGVVAWGIVPAEYKIFATETPETLYQKYLAIRTRLCSSMPEDLFDAQSLITPSCGIRFAERSGALAIMKTTEQISQRIRHKELGA